VIDLVEDYLNHEPGLLLLLLLLLFLIYLLFYDQVKFHTAIGRSQLSEHDDVSHLIL